MLRRLFLMCPFLARILTILALKAHSKAYEIAGRASQFIEPDGLHPKHRLMKYHDWFASHLSSSDNVLDIGCGNGALAYDLGKSCKSVTALDINPVNIERANAKHRRENVTYMVADATTHDFDHPFDVIVLSNVLEHIADRPTFLKKVYANQKADNPPPLLLRVPMLNREWITLYKKEKGLEWRLDPTHETEYTQQQLESELAEADLFIKDISINFGEFWAVVEKKK